jgi:hypothetical protein
MCAGQPSPPTPAIPKSHSLSQEELIFVIWYNFERSATTGTGSAARTAEAEDQVVGRGRDDEPREPRQARTNEAEKLAAT